MIKMKSEYVFNDQLILDEFCNLKCKYCGGFYPSEFHLKQDSNGKINMPESWKEMIRKNHDLSDRISENPTVGDFFKLAEDVLSKIEQATDYKILKISGGEIFLYKDIVDFIEKIHKKFAAVQLLTNGLTLTSNQITQLRKLGNIYFQISLDGVTGEANFARNGSDKVVKKILNDIEQILEQGMGLEINCVLTKYNTGLFEEMLNYFKDSKNLVIAPRPVRGKPKAALNFSEEQLESFKKIAIKNYQIYANILPSKHYMERLVSLMETGTRKWKCYVPYYVLGANNYGDISTCTCTGELPRIGNIFNESEKIGNIFSKNEGYIPQKKYSACSYCITQYEMLNLYTEDLINRADMEKVPSFRIPGVMDRVDLIKKRLIDLNLVN